MKKLFTILAIVCVTSLAFTSCMEENILPDALEGSGGNPGGSAGEDEICVQLGTCPDKKN
jgi:hypothetical protein